MRKPYTIFEFGPHFCVHFCCVWQAHLIIMIHGTSDLAIGVDIHLCSKKGSRLIS